MATLQKRSYLNVINIKPILEIIGILLSILAGMMLLPIAVDVAMGNSDWHVFSTAAFISAFVGIMLILSNHGHIHILTHRQTFLLIVLAWLIIPAFAALPFIFAYPHIGYSNAFFESMSGLSSCGATILQNLDTAPAGILLWRSLLNWVGGIAIIVIAIAILPVLRIGGMQLFKNDSLDKSDKITLRTIQLLRSMLAIYCFYTLFSALLLWFAGMSGFDAICHAMAAISAGGSGNYSNSIAHFNSPVIEIILIITMIISCLPFTLYIQAAQGRYTALWKNSQLRAFLCLLCLAILSVACWLTYNQQMTFFQSIRFASFNVTSAMTTSGLSLGSTASWGTYPIFLLFLITLIGGCSKSAAGGIKIFRIQILYQTVKAHIKQILHPHAIFRPSFNNKSVSDAIISSVLVFFFVYISILMIFILLLTVNGVDFMIASNLVASSMASSGYGFNSLNTVSTIFALPNFTKWVLSIAMMMGRLEFLTILVLFSPSFWRD